MGLVTLSGVRCMTPCRGADASCAPVSCVSWQLRPGCDSFGVNCTSVGQGGVGRGVSVIVARVLQLPAFDYNAPHVGVLGVCASVCVLGVLGILGLLGVLSVLGIRWIRALCTPASFALITR